MKPCPNCGYRHADIDYAPELDGLKMPPKERDVILRLKQAGGAQVSFSQMMDFVYGDDPEGGPLSIALYSHVSKARKKIMPLGWDIEAERFRGYRLVKI